MKKQDPNNYWEQLERLEKLFRASEIKAGVLFSFHSLILGIIADRIHLYKSILEESNLLIAIGFVWVFLVVLSLFYCFKSFRPKLELNYKKNVFFFRDASQKFGSVEDYVKKIIEVCGSEQFLYEQLSEQIHAESKIIDSKFRSVNNSIRFFGISFILLITIIIILLSKVQT